MISKMSKQEGFTLIEIIVSILLFTIGVLGMMSLQVLATRGSVIGNNNTVANYLAQSVAGQLEQLQFTDTTLATGNHGYKVSNDQCLSCANCTNPVNSFGQCNGGIDNVYRVNWFVAYAMSNGSPTPDNLKTILITVEWGHGNFLITLPVVHY